MKKNAMSIFAAAAAVTAFASDFRMFNIVPPPNGDEAALAAEMAEYRARTGEDTVLCEFPCHPEGRPARAKIDRYVASYRRFAEECRKADPGLKVGVLIQSVLGHFVGDRVPGEDEPWQRSIDNKGREYRWCPLDPDFREYIHYVARRFAAEKPCLIMTDDDIRNINGDCFCPIHAAELNRRTGRSRTPEEWRKAALASKVGDADYNAYFTLQREGLEGINAIVRKAIDEVDPSIPGCVCMGGEDYRFSGRHARAIAAKGQTPMQRISNSLYLEHQRGQYPFPEIVTRTQMHVADYEDEDMILLDEADTWPQNLWSKSATSFYSHMVMGAMCGLKGAKIWFVNAHRAGGQPYPRQYTDVMAAHRGYCSAIVRAISGMKAGGVITPTILRESDFHVGMPSGGNNRSPRPAHTWAGSFFAHFGVPFTATRHFERDGVWELAGADAVSRLDDATLKTILSHKAILDGKAALALVERGFADLVGVDAKAESPAINRELWPDGTSAGRHIRRDGSPTFAARPGAKVLTQLCRISEGKPSVPVAPGSVLFDNPLGGRVLSVAFGDCAVFYNLYNVERKRFLERALAELNGGAFDFIVRNEQDFVSLVRESPDGRTAVVAAFNLCYDTVDSLRLTLAAKPTKVELLRPCGEWVDADWRWSDGELGVKCTIPCAAEAVVRISK